MYILITEHQSDFDAVKTIIRRLSGQPELTVKGRGFNGAGEINNKGAVTIQSLLTTQTQGCVIVRDCDGIDGSQKFKSLKSDVVDKIKTKTKPSFCIVLPRHELEAWYLADIKCVTNVWKQWRPEREFGNPESYEKAKEELLKISRTGNLKPRYSTGDGKNIAMHMDLDVVRKKCPSFGPLYDFITHGKGNV
ncbi:DUF4276 family protein [Burkholderia cenocepacia]|uniref:DUF4276 family protein n=1 Tax=Burkholderia cenocepacia TaxID=95486 RepID=UPI00285CC815|nr:DUF4276 family protein [Burkholderia cenocepacia]MDR8049890.1 DUF4276 family protein [Burkholderia cenocepacia]